MNLAYMEMRVILAKMAWEFDWELLSQGVDWARDLEIYILAKKPAVKVRFIPRAKA